MREGEDSVASTSSRTAATHESQSEQSSGVELIAAERARQMQQEGWTPAHDDDHGDNELLRGAACYVWAARQAALPLGERMSFWDVTYPDQRGTRAWPVPSWPWEACWWKPTTDSVRNLVKAGALIAAEIDRMQREHKAVVASTETHGDGNQLPSGLRGHPGVPCTPTAGTRDLESSSADSIPLPRHPSERQTPIAPDSEWQSFIRSAWQHIDTCTAGPCEECRAIYARLTVTRVKP